MASAKYPKQSPQVRYSFARRIIDSMRSLLDGRELELDRMGRPSTQKPCLSDPDERRCRTADKVGYACYGCIGPKFPLSKPLFKQRELPRAA